jgi:hypothetical protein
MKYAIEMGSGAMIYLYIQSCMKVSSGIQKLMGGGIHTYAHNRLSHKPTFILSK